jgi:hypothetical protein
LVFGALAMDVASFGYCPRLRSTAQGYLAFESDCFFSSVSDGTTPLGCFRLTYWRLSEKPRYPPLADLLVFVGIKSLHGTVWLEQPGGPFLGRIWQITSYAMAGRCKLGMAHEF